MYKSQLFIKYLQLKNIKIQEKEPLNLITIKKKYFHYINNKYINYDINNNNDEYNLFIVYYINCLINPNYFDWLYNQINLVRKMNGTIYIIATISIDKEQYFRNKCLQYFPNVIIECNYINQYEYSGILKVWNLGQIHNKKNDIILYIHSKGLSRNTNYCSNKKDNYNIILKDINIIKEIFSIFQKIDKIGYYSGGIGLMWYNFWYARGSYIFEIEKPIITTRRHYYEDWLSRKPKNNIKIVDYERDLSEYYNTLDSCYQFYSDKNTCGNIGYYYCPATDKIYKT